MAETNGEATELYRRYRPTKLDGLIGQPAAVKSLKKMIETGTIPHAILLSGPSGTGKTTAARILRRHLRCKERDFSELNCAEARGIDTVREIQTRMNLAPMPGGKSRIWLLDECFDANTPVTCEAGKKPISEIVPGDHVLSMAGFSQVRHTFKNIVGLDRVVRVSFTDGRTLYTTKQHEIFTEGGWTAVQDLRFGALILGEFCYSMDNHRSSNEKIQNMRNMPKRIPGGLQKTPDVFQELRMASQGKTLWQGLDGQETGIQKEEAVQLVQSRVRGTRPSGSAGVLFKTLRSTSEGKQIGAGQSGLSAVSFLREVVLAETIASKDMLRPFVRQEVGHAGPGIPSEGTQSNCGGEDRRRSCGILQDAQREVAGDPSRRTAPPYYAGFRNRPANLCQRPCDQGKERNPANLERQAGRERNVYPAAMPIAQGSSQNIAFVVSGNGDLVGNQEAWLSDVLQSRCWQPPLADWCRGRWAGASVESEYLERCQERRDAHAIRVASVEVYEQGRNDAAFVGVIGDREREQGYVEFYDLEIEGHPSYFANGVPVHNCARLTPDAQSALLKTLEDTPRHVYFMLATTDPQKLLPTIRTRCTEVITKALPPKEVKRLVQGVVQAEGASMAEAVLDKLAELSEGSARKALVLLHQVIGLDADQQLGALESTEANAAAIDLARALLAKKPWKEIAKVVSDLKQEDPEGLRRMIAAYAASVLLSGGRGAERAGLLLEVFCEPWYDVGMARAMLVLSCKRVTDS